MVKHSVEQNIGNDMVKDSVKQDGGNGKDEKLIEQNNANDTGKNPIEHSIGNARDEVFIEQSSGEKQQSSKRGWESAVATIEARLDAVRDGQVDC